MNENTALVPLADTMQLGDVSRRDLVGLRGRDKVVWAACPMCGARRWVTAKNPQQVCRSCQGIHLGKQRIRFWNEMEHTKDCQCARCHTKDQRGDKNPGWRGGRRMHQDGYQYVLVADDDPMRCMGARDGYVLEHRLVMARYLNRPLTARETVHHRNGNRTDNRIENLELWIGNHGNGSRLSDYHCPGCQCFKKESTS